MDIRIAGIAKESVVDGPGLRFVVFTQGCPHQCIGCHNPNTHDPDGGYMLDSDEILGMIDSTKLISGVTFSGGEPFLQAGKLAYLARQIRAKGLDIVTYTGFLFEQLLAMSSRNRDVRLLLALTDILVDGPYRAAERDISLPFRGSHNQRLINVPRSLTLGRVVLWVDEAAEVRLRA